MQGQTVFSQDNSNTNFSLGQALNLVSETGIKYENVLNCAVYDVRFGLELG